MTVSVTPSCPTVAGSRAFADGFKNPFYVAIDRSSGRCVMMQFMGAGGPGGRYQVMGTYGSMRSAHKAMTHMAGCH